MTKHPSFAFPNQIIILLLLLSLERAFTSASVRINYNIITSNIISDITSSCWYTNISLVPSKIHIYWMILLYLELYHHLNNGNVTNRFLITSSFSQYIIIGYWIYFKWILWLSSWWYIIHRKICLKFVWIWYHHKSYLRTILWSILVSWESEKWQDQNEYNIVLCLVLDLGKNDKLYFVGIYFQIFKCANV